MRNRSINQPIRNQQPHRYLETGRKNSKRQARAAALARRKNALREDSKRNRPLQHDSAIKCKHHFYHRQ